MSRRKIPVDIVATMRLPRDPEKAIELDLGGLKWHAYGTETIGPAHATMLDLLEIARVVHEFDRRQPKRTTGVRIKQVRVTMPLRVPERWTPAAKTELCSLLRIQGNAEWIFDFKKRANSKSKADLLFASSLQTKRNSKKVGNASQSGSDIQTVALFSGGLDSTSGLATLVKQADKTLLVGYYSQNRLKQVNIAEKLGFHHFAQIKSEWTVPKSAGRSGGQFVYRSFLFLSLAAVFVDATSAKSLLQFENGPLALSVPPLGIYRMTRHAHPLVHRHFSDLFRHLTGRSLAISNPFLAMTKGEAVSLLKSHLSKADFREVIGTTESCWYLSSRTIIAGPPRKRNGEACGACVPCLVRRSALKNDDIKAGVDFKNGIGRAERDPVVRVHFEAYSGFAKRLLDKNYGVHNFMEDVPTATKAALDGASSMDPNMAFDLYRRFAREWIKAFA